VGEVAVGSLWSYAVAGYILTAVALAGYIGSLFLRARRARLRAAAIAARRGRRDVSADVP
jgi:hypothetical protein